MDIYTPPCDFTINTFDSLLCCNSFRYIPTIVERFAHMSDVGLIFLDWIDGWMDGWKGNIIFI
jgi:hypothetical protein